MSHFTFVSRRSLWGYMAHLKNRTGASFSNILAAACERLVRDKTKYRLTVVFGGGLRFEKQERGRWMVLPAFDPETMKEDIDKKQKSNPNTMHIYLNDRLIDAEYVLESFYPVAKVDVADALLKLAVEDNWAWDAGDFV